MPGKQQNIPYYAVCDKLVVLQELCLRCQTCHTFLCLNNQIKLIPHQLQQSNVMIKVKSTTSIKENLWEMEQKCVECQKRKFQLQNTLVI